MNKEQEEEIKKSIERAFDFKSKYSDFEISRATQLLGEQSDLIKNFASIVVAIIGFGYFFNRIEVSIFSLLAFCISIFSLVLFFSYIKERIDQQALELKEIRGKINNETNNHIKISLESIEKRDWSIFTKYLKKQVSKKIKANNTMNYFGEISLFLFYLILFLLVAVISLDIYDFKIFWQLIILLLIIAISWIMSFKKWSIDFIKILSRNIEIKKKKND